MGKTTKWLKYLFGLKKEKNQSNSRDRKNKIPSCIGGSHGTPIGSPENTPLIKPVRNHNYDEQNQHAIAVAVATATAADAAVAAAQAAVMLVRMTSRNWMTTPAGDRENSAAIFIQTMFRGYLSRKALKALKSLVKVQALVRGVLVRKRTFKTLKRMEAMSRLQSNLSTQRSSLKDGKFHSTRSTRRGSEARSRRMSSPFQIPIDEKPTFIEVDQPKSRLTRRNTWAWEADIRTPSPLLSYSHRRLSIPVFSTTHNTPRFAYTCKPNDYQSISKDDYFASHPGYMANTESFRAKARSKSAPKQRLGLHRRVGPSEVECGPGIGKPKSKSTSPLIVNNVKNFIMSRMGKS